MTLLREGDSLERQNQKLMRITQALMRRVEKSPDNAGLAYGQFERAALLEKEVRQRTTDLERALDLLQQSNAQLAEVHEEAESSRAYLRDAIENIDEGFALFDSQDRLVLFNTRFCKDLPDVRDQMEPGLPFADYVALVSDSPGLTREEGQSAEDWRDMRLSRHWNEHVVFNVRLHRERWLQVSEHRTATGGTVVLQTDVTGLMRDERRERDRLLNRQARLLRATLDHLNQGVCIFDREQRLAGWNYQMERLLDRSVGDRVLGMQFDSLLDRLDETFDFSGDVRKSQLVSWARQTRGRDPITFEVRRGAEDVFEVFAQQMPDRGFVISFTDVSDARRQSRALQDLNDSLERRVHARTEALGLALEDARRANASKTRFVAAASHDLLQPMSAAKLYASALEDRVAPGADTELVHKTISALESAEGIIQALLDISKLDSGLAVFDMGSVRLGDIFTALTTEFAPLAAARGIDLRVVPVRLSVHSDAVFLRRVVQNLLSNALRYTTGRKVLLGARRVNGQARIEVWDQGPGIDAKHHKDVFQEFRQLEDGRRGAQGLGLGLAIVDRACRMLEHDLQLTSEVGVGSCFSVGVGIAQTPATAVTPRDSGPQTKQDETQGRLVCLVENDLALSQSIALTIEACGSDVIWAPDGEAAIDLLHELDIVPDCLLLDYQLGEGPNGIELLDRLHAEYGPIPAEIISASRAPELIAACTARDIRLRHKPLSREAIREFLSSTPQ